MNTLEPETKRFRANFVKNLAKSKTRHKNPLHNPPVDHRNVPPHIKDMWEVYLGFTKFEF